MLTATARQSFLQACFLCMKPVENLLSKQIALFEQLDDPQFVTSYFALEISGRSTVRCCC